MLQEDVLDLISSEAYRVAYQDFFHQPWTYQQRKKFEEALVVPTKTQTWLMIASHLMVVGFPAWSHRILVEIVQSSEPSDEQQRALVGQAHYRLGIGYQDRLPGYAQATEWEADQKALFHLRKAHELGYVPPRPYTNSTHHTAPVDTANSQTTDHQTAGRQHLLACIERLIQKLINASAYAFTLLSQNCARKSATTPGLSKPAVADNTGSLRNARS